jgi:hypothetical protein
VENAGRLSCPKRSDIPVPKMPTVSPALAELARKVLRLGLLGFVFMAFGLDIRSYTILRIFDFKSTFSRPQEQGFSFQDKCVSLQFIREKFFQTPQTDGPTPGHAILQVPRHGQ